MDIRDSVFIINVLPGLEMVLADINIPTPGGATQRAIFNQEGTLSCERVICVVDCDER